MQTWGADAAVSRPYAVRGSWPPALYESSDYSSHHLRKRVEMVQEEPSDEQTPGDQPSLTAMIGRGIMAGLAGTVAMTVFQKPVEMPLTGREDSYAPAKSRKRCSHPPQQ